MSNLLLGFFLVGSLLMLGLTVWSVRLRDLERQGKPKTAVLFGVFLTLMGLTYALGAGRDLATMDAARQIVVGLTTGGFTAAALLMFTRAWSMRRSAPES